MRSLRAGRIEREEDTRGEAGASPTDTSANHAAQCASKSCTSRRMSPAIAASPGLSARICRNAGAISSTRTRSESVSAPARPYSCSTNRTTVPGPPGLLPSREPATRVERTTPGGAQRQQDRKPGYLAVPWPVPGSGRGTRRSNRYVQTVQARKHPGIERCVDILLSRCGDRKSNASSKRKRYTANYAPPRADSPSTLRSLRSARFTCIFTAASVMSSDRAISAYR